MTSHSTAIYTPFADGRTVRDIVEHSPALVTEAWCRQLLRQVLQSLEQQYASGAPHRPITPDSIVMLDSGETLLLSPPDTGATPGSAGEANLAADLYALALVVHYAISAELPPEGPLGPRLYDDYSANLTQTIDRCLGPNQRLRPKSIAELRTMLGFEQEAMAEPAPAAALAVAATADTAVTGEQPMPDMAGLHATPVPEGRFPEPSAQPQPREQEAPAVAAALHPGTDAFSRPAPAATPLKPSSHPAPEAAVPNPPAATQAPAPWARSSLERWAMVAGAAVVLLAAGGALYTHLNQDNSADLVALSLPPQEQAARGLAPGEAVVAPAAEAANQDGAAPAGELATTGAPAGDPAAAAALTAAAHAAPSPGTAGGARQADAVVNGTTYKLLIKPWGTVYVNGIDRGVSPPVKRLTLGQGQHTIRIVNPNFPEHVMTVTAGDAENATIEHDFTAQAEGGR